MDPVRDEEISVDYFKELDNLEKAGVSLSEAVGSVVAPGGDELPTVVDHQLAQQGLNELMKLFPKTNGDTTTAGSATPSHSEDFEAPSSSNRDPSRVPSLHGERPPLPPATRDRRRHSVDNSELEAPAIKAFNENLEARRRKKAKRRHKADELFQVVSYNEETGSGECYECIQCELKVFAKKRRYRIFHLIIYSGLSIEKLFVFYMRSRDKDKLPLIKNPIRGVTVAGARRVWEEEQRRRSAAGLAGDYNATTVPSHAGYLLAKRKLDLTTPIKDCPAEHQDVAANLLVKYFIDENIPIATCDSNNGYPRELVKVLNYLRPGFKVPSGTKLGGELLDRYHAQMQNNLRSRLPELLQDCHGTLMFHGSEDINSAPMVNVLIRVMCTALMSTQMFFLTTVSTVTTPLTPTIMCALPKRP